MAVDVALSARALSAARDGDPDLLANELSGPEGDGRDRAAALAGSVVVARWLLASSDGLRRVDLHAGDGIALLLDGDGGEPSVRRPGLVARHLDALVHVLVESVGLGWRPTPTPRHPFEVDDPTDVPSGVVDLPGSSLSSRLGPTVDPAGMHWWSLQVPGPGSRSADELTVLDAERAGLFRQDGTRLEPTTTRAVWQQLQELLPFG